MFFLILAAGIIGFQLVLPFLTVCATRLFGKETLPTSQTDVPTDFGCIITAYRNAAIAQPLVASLLKQQHPHFHIYLVADECAPDFDLGIQDPRVTVLLPQPPLRLKAKSIIHAITHFERKHDYIAIFDADNLAHPSFLSEINRYVAAGYRCIQGQRTAKNLDNSFAAADSLGELYKNYVERYTPWLLGSSSVISGSGMATEAVLYQAYLDSPEISEGQHQWKKMLQEDKILQNFLLRRNERIAYARTAVCYDEKVQSGEAVQTQRSRWIFSYFQNIPNTLGILRRAITRGHWNQLLFGLVTLSLPMFIQLGVAGLLWLVALFVAPWISVLLTIAVLIFGATVLWTLRLSDAPMEVWAAVYKMPAFVWRQVMGLLKMGNPNKNFKHTEHTQYVSVEEVLKREGELPK